jgi:hypothetical protein
MRIYWLSWQHSKKLGSYELHWPWWVSGCDDGGYHSLCAAIIARDEDAVREVVYDCYDARPQHIEFRFIEERPDHFVPYSDRFRWQSWMPVFDEAFDPVALMRKQAEASAAAKKNYQATLALQSQDDAVMALPSRVVLLDEALAAATAVLQKSVGGTACAASVEEATQALTAKLSDVKGYRPLRERPLDEYEQGLFIVSDDSDGTIYMKTDDGGFYDLEGNEIVAGFSRSPLVKPIRLAL